MNVTIIGGGNVGMCLAGEISRLANYSVTLYASHPEQFDERFLVTDTEKGISFYSGIVKTTDNLKTALENAQVVLVTLPAHLRKDFVQKISSLLRPNSYLGFIPAYGGAEFFCKELIEKGVTIFGLQKSPYVARTVQRGKEAGLWSKKKELKVAALPASKTPEVVRLLEDMLQIKTIGLSNYMGVTLLPGNPLLHTAGSSVYLENYSEGMTYPEQIYYYRSWNDQCSKVICDFSDEMMAICEAMPLDLSAVDSIQTYYESPTPEDLTRKFHSIPSFHDLVLPMIQTEKGFVPDFSSRFFIEDFPNGVSIIKALGQLTEIPTPTIDSILEWYKRMTGKEYFKQDGSYGKDIHETAIPQLFGITNVEQLKEFYLQ